MIETAVKSELRAAWLDRVLVKDVWSVICQNLPGNNMLLSVVAGVFIFANPKWLILYFTCHSETVPLKWEAFSVEKVAGLQKSTYFSCPKGVLSWDWVYYFSKVYWLRNKEGSCDKGPVGRPDGFVLRGKGRFWQLKSQGTGVLQIWLCLEERVHFALKKITSHALTKIYLTNRNLR